MKDDYAAVAETEKAARNDVEFAPHDPKFAAEGRTFNDGQPCNRDCPEPWPCAERRRQRATRKRLLERLQADGYKPDRARSGRNELLWTDGPLPTFEVREGYGESGLWARIERPGAEPMAPTGDVNDDWMRTYLP